MRKFKFFPLWLYISIMKERPKVGFHGVFYYLHCVYFYSPFSRWFLWFNILFAQTLQDGEAYAHLLNVLAPEHSSPSTLSVKNPLERAKLILEHADRMGCKRYLTAKDIVEGSPNLNLAFVAHIFQHRWGWILMSICSI